MNVPLWDLEWRLAVRRRRLFVLNMAIPLLLVVPLATSGAPAFHAAAAYAVLFVLFGVFGSAIPLLREGEGGLLRRILLAGAPEWGILLQRTLAASLIDFVQLLPALAVILVTGGAGPSVWVLGAAVLLPSLLAANLVGVWVAAAARSLAEGALFAAVVGLFLLHGSGVFRAAAPDGPQALAERLLPFGALHQTLLHASGGGAGAAGARFEAVLQPLGAGLLLLALTALLARLLLDRIAPAVRP